MRREREELKLSDVQSAIFKLSNALRRDRSLIYRFSADLRVVLVAVMVDPKGTYARLLQYIKLSDQLGSWEDVKKLADEQGFNLDELAELMGGKADALEKLYARVRGLVNEAGE